MTAKLFIRIEPKSAMPIYRQIIDQIKYQIATGLLQAHQQMPSVRQLANQLAVNQNTILKVYTRLCQEKVLEAARGSGTFVAGTTQVLGGVQKKELVRQALKQTAILAKQFGLEYEDVLALLEQEYSTIQKGEESV